LTKQIQIQICTELQSQKHSTVTHTSESNQCYSESESATARPLFTFNSCFSIVLNSTEFYWILNDKVLNSRSVTVSVTI